MKKTYTVAGHTFSFIMDETDALWSRLGQYEPFLTGEDSTDRVFELQKLEELPDCPQDAVPVYDPMEGNKDEPRVEVYSVPEGYEFRFAVTLSSPTLGRMTCDKDFRKGQFCMVPNASTADAIFVLNCAAMALYTMSTACMNTLLMHASVTVLDGKAYMFLGESGAGKSTHSRMWKKAFGEKTMLLNDDNPVVRFDGKAVVYGSPWSGKTPCYIDASAPVSGIAHIHKAPHNESVRLSPFEGYIKMLPACSCIWQIDKLNRGVSSTIEHVCDSVPAIVLKCLPDEESALVCLNAFNLT